MAEFWRYDYYGGPGISGEGKARDPFSVSMEEDINKIQKVSRDYVKMPKDAVDWCFFRHDVRYALAERSATLTDEREAIIRADVQLLKELYALDTATLNDVAKSARNQAITAFVVKMVYNGLQLTLANAYGVFVQPIGDILAGLVYDPTLPPLDPETESRAEAWYETRYYMNEYVRDSQMADLMYSEAAELGLYDNSLSEELRMKDVMRMYTVHEIFQGRLDPSRMLTAYESVLAPSSGTASIETEISAAKNYLITQFADGNPIDNVLVGRGLSTYEYKEDGKYNDANLLGTSQNDLIFGERGDDKIDGGSQNDVIYGGAGNDKITGGTGDDILYGGADNDDYYFSAGGGNDKIVDTEGTNRIFRVDEQGNEHFIGNAYKDGTTNVWTAPDGSYQITQNSPYTITLPDGSTIELGSDFEDGDFGIRLIDIPDNPQTTNTITGDTDPEHLNDQLGDSAADDRIEGLSGNDDISSTLGGNDWLLGGDGMDVVISQNATGKDILEGGTGSDILWGGPDDDKVFAENYGEMEALIVDGETAQGISERGDLASGAWGNDFIYGSNARDLLFGSEGHDVIVGGAGDDAILGDDEFTYATRDWSFAVLTDENNVWAHSLWTYGIDRIEGSVYGDDVIYAGAGNDFVNAGGGNDEVYAGDGNDTVFGSRGDDFIEGGNGNDILVGDEFSIPLDQQGNDYIDGGDGDDMIRGDAGNDELYGGAGNDTIYGDGDVDDERIGDDYIDGEAGEDMLYGGAGNDTIFGGEGDDYIEGDGLTAGDDYIDGEAGNDTIIGAGGSDQIYGGDGDDILHGDAGNVPLSDQADDYIDGGMGNDVIVGYAGNDELYGGAGNDTIYGDSGNDYIEGGTGDDYIQAGSGDNTIYGDDGNDQIQAGAGDDYIDGGAGADIIVAGDGANTIYGGDGNDQISGGSGNDYIEAGVGNDTVYGGGGNDEVFGKSGIDTIYADAGDDFIDGGVDADYMYGGIGNDTYVVDNPSDWVVEYANQGIDTVLSSITHTLSGHVENLILTGSADINGSGNSMDNILIGNSGNNTLSGEEGNDIYIFGRGSGVDTVNNFSSDFFVVTTDAIHFGEGIADTDLELIRENYNLRITINGTADSLVIKDYYCGERHIVDQFMFADGTVLTASQMETKVSQVYDTSNSIYGTASNDFLPGSVGDDRIFGYEGNDNINGSYGNDVLDGGSGVDILQGGPGNDTYKFDRGGGTDLIDNSAPDNTKTIDTMEIGEGITSGDIELFVEWSDLRIAVKDSPDSVVIKNALWYNESSYDRFPYMVDQFKFADGAILTTGQILAIDCKVYGSGGKNYLEGLSGNDQIFGYEGDDQLSGLSGNDVLDGGPGNDRLEGGYGSDIYKFEKGGGVDTIYNYYELDSATTTDMVEFGEGITSDDLELIGEGNDLRIHIRDTYDSLIIHDGLGEMTSFIDQFQFVDGTILTPAQLKARGWAVYGSAGNDVLFGGGQMFGYDGDDKINGSNGNDIIDGGKGNDTIYSAAGDDTYIFGIGSGVDTLSGVMTNNTVAFGEGIAADDLELIQEGNNFRINIQGTSDALIIKDWFSTEVAKIGQFTFSDDTVLTAAQMEAKGYSVADAGITYYGTDNDDLIQGGGGHDKLYGYDGNDTLYGNTGDDSLFGGNGNDVLDGGAGFDTLQGDGGSDTYTFGRGSGVDTINNFTADYATTTDTVAFGEGISSADLDLVKEGSDLHINIAGSTDACIIKSWFSGDSCKVDQFTFADGTVLTAVQMEAMASKVQGTAGGETISGTGVNNTIYGYRGDDTLSGGAGDDILDGDAGNDTLMGDAGNDTYIFGRGSGVDWISNWSSDYASTTDAIEFCAGITVNDLELIVDSEVGYNNLRINIKDSSDALMIDNWFAGDAYKIDRFLFADGTELTAAQLEATGCKSYGFYHKGTSGNDRMYGYLGDDTYKFGRGSGVDKIFNYARDYATTSDTVELGTGITAADLKLVKYRDDLRINITGATDSLIINNWFQGDAYQVDRFTFTNGTVMTAAQLEAMGYETNNTIYGTPNDDYLIGSDLDDQIIGYEGNDTLIGGGGNDIIEGGAGNDIIDGGTGADTMIGGTGNDTYVVENMDDAITENASEGIDEVQSSLSYTLGANIENLFLTGNDAVNGSGNELDNVLIGNSADNVVSGGAGNDTIAGGTGNDTLYGEAGDDTYIYNIGDGLDHIHDSAGNDTLTMGEGLDFDHTVIRLDSSNVHLRLLDSEYNETSQGVYITRNYDGSISVETISFVNGDSYDMSQLVVDEETTYGSDISDIIITGRNDDTVYASNGSDFVRAGTGNDTVYGGNDADVLFGDGGNDALYGEGSADVLYGGNGNDLLDGGASFDLMIGGHGNDTYVVDNSFDVIVEFADEGIDNVKSSVSRTLGSYVENLELTGSANINGTGNRLDNVIIGNSGINTLTGNDGNDTLDGRGGNDTLIGGNGSDIYIFRRNDGIDTVNETAGVIGDTDMVKMTGGITRTEPVIVKQNNDLYLFIDSSNYTKITNQFYRPDYGVEKLEVTDGCYVTRSDIENIVETMSAINNDAGMDVIQKYNAMRTDPTYISTLSQSWHQP